MYKAMIRTLFRRNLRQHNQGNLQPLLKMAGPDAELAFPGDNSWAAMFRPVERSRTPNTTHRGPAELEAFAQRFGEHRLAIEVDDILVNGPPWRTRICARVTDGTPDGVYANRVCLFVEARWGQIHRWEDYLDTERVAACDRHLVWTASTPRAPTATATLPGPYRRARPAWPARPAAQQPPPEMARQVDAAATRQRILTASGELMRRRQGLLAAIRADLLRRLGRHPEAADAYRMVLEIAPTDAKRLYLTRLADTAATE